MLHKITNSVIYKVNQQEHLNYTIKRQIILSLYFSKKTTVLYKII